jgi:hypothetical protein
MTFRRTSKSLHSLHLFFSVDFVVFCEGGGTDLTNLKSKEDNQISTNDALFWEAAFGYSETIKGRKHIKSVGGKSHILSLIEDIKKENVKQIFVCLDRDYDELNGRMKTDKFVFYTRGYSWENDVCEEYYLKQIFFYFFY